MNSATNTAEILPGLPEICTEIDRMLWEYDSGRIRIQPNPNNRASEAGHDCERYLVYARRNWREKIRHDARLQRVFDEGVLQEQAILQKLAAAGIVVVEQQRSLEWKQFQLTGHIDGKLSWDGELYPLEIKSFSAVNFNAIDTVEDMIRSKHGYMRKYPVQMQLYLLMDESPEGLFLLKDKSSGAIKLVPCRLDYEFAEKILQKLERVNAHVAAGTYPDRCEYSDGLCGQCLLRHLCLPDKDYGSAEFIADSDFIFTLERREELKESVKEYEELDEEVKSRVKPYETDIIAGNFLLKRKHIVKTIQPKAAYTQDYWTTTISQLGR